MTHQQANQTLVLVNETSIEQWYNTYYSILCVYANKFLKDLDLSRELVQDVFVKLYDKKEALSIHTSAKSHLYQSVKNACLNSIKQKQTHALHHENIKYLNGDFSYETDELYGQSELEYELHKAIEELPEKCRDIFKMNRMEGLSNQEIADYLNISKRTVETQISKALKTLRNQLAPSLLKTILLLLLSSIE